MKLYDFPFSPNSRKVRAVAYELGIRLELAPVNLLTDEQRSPAFLAKNPNGRVPVLDDDGYLLWESTAIVRYLAAGSALMPADRRVCAEVDRWVSWQLAHLSPAMSMVSYERLVKPLTRRGEPDPARIAQGTADFEKLTGIFDAALAGRDHVAGPLTIADFALAAHYSLADAAGLSLARFERVSGWLARMAARPSLKRALDEARV